MEVFIFFVRGVFLLFGPERLGPDTGHVPPFAPLKKYFWFTGVYIIYIAKKT